MMKLESFWLLQFKNLLKNNNKAYLIKHKNQICNLIIKKQIEVSLKVKVIDLLKVNFKKVKNSKKSKIIKTKNYMASII
jgi:hypothetical protein